MTDFQNYLGRIKQASPGEVAYRARRLLLTEALKHASPRQTSIVAVPPWNRVRVQRLALPRIDFTSEENTGSGGQPPTGDRPATLNTDPDSIRAFENACRNLFFTSVGRRCGGIDIRSVWEPARLQHLVRSFLLGEPPENHAAQVEVLQWIAGNPFLQGPHYLSPMECGLRVPVFFYCLKSMVKEAEEDGDSVAAAIYRHAWWIYRNLSLHNSLGNHTVCECIGLIFAGAVFGHTREGGKWLALGCQLLDQEIDHQVLPDGGPAEQSIAYHRFVLDLFWLASRFLRDNGLHDCQPWREILEAGEAFLAAFWIDQHRYIPIGDSDDGCAVAPGFHLRRPALKLPAKRIQHFDRAGYTVIRDGDMLLTFDHGPLGMAPLYNHGHADALSITLTYRGQPVLIDPGTYRYNGVPEWRRYFKSTRAHNTVTVDGMDQANQASGFIWTRAYESRVVDRVEDGGGFSIEAQHNGYCRLECPVRHFRRVSYPGGGALHIRDRFGGCGHHTFELNFHIGQARSIEKVDGWWHLDFEEFVVWLTVRENMESALVCGHTDPPFGWNAPRYGEKHPSHVITYQQSAGTPDVRFTTVIFCRDK